ncbi:septum site-determining protein MinD [Roseovarius sp. A-2]|uniref:AAA family ATPase n=1 Tax=Roseovarius sp. A-2 TaxID=1570360 RepID=UPI0009B5709A|nr:AAA family ATPase [Roseovarius sp. A-2]GAW34111.1 septum site-determining protein MinD [Roseovarius sp. A-2]
MMKQTDPAPITACTISRDVQNFDLLIEDMEAALGEAWGDLGFSEALAFIGQPEAASLEFVAIAIDESDEADLALLGEIIALAQQADIKSILIAEDVSPAALHQLLRKGADEFVPYPLPEGELQAAIDRLKRPAATITAPATSAPLAQTTDGDGVILAVQGLAGGTGATTLAVNLAWELANVEKAKPPQVCLLDFSLQFGSVSTFLDLPRRDVVFEMWSDTDILDEDVFRQALVTFEDKMRVLTAPTDIPPLDMINSEDVTRVLELARSHFDYVIVDMPTTLVQWTEAVLSMCQIYFTTLELDMRSAQNALRVKRALQSEGLPVEKLRYCLNRAPKFTDINGKSRVKRMAESLEIGIELQLPDGGRAVSQSCDHGLPLASSAAKNPLRREIAKLAQSLHALGKDDAEAA